MKPMNIDLCPKGVFKKNLYLILFLLCANILGIVSTHYFEHDFVHDVSSLFDFDGENNIPTLYSSFALILVSILLSFIAFTRIKLKLSSIPWFGLSIIFLFLSIDEISTIHEEIGGIVRETFETSGFLYYAWVIPYGIALVVFIVAYSKFLFVLPKSTMILFLVSGAIYVSGALGFELLGGRHADLHGTDSILYSTITTCEEFLEMLGIAIFTYTLLTYIVDQFESMIITVAKD